MSKSVKLEAVWLATSNGGTPCPWRLRGHLDSINLRRPSRIRRTPDRIHRVVHTGISRRDDADRLSSRIYSCRRRGFGQLLSADLGPRRFSTSTPKRSYGFDEEEDDDELDSAANASEIRIMLRRRAVLIKEAKEKEQALIRRRIELYDRFASYVNELAAPKLLVQKMERDVKARKQARRIWMERYERVVNSSVPVVNVADGIFEEYFFLKHHKLRPTRWLSEKMTVEVQNSWAELSSIREALRRINWVARRIEFEKLIREQDEALASFAEDFASGYVSPKAQARRNMEKILTPLADFRRAYAALQEIGGRIAQTRSEMRYIWRQIEVRGNLLLERRLKLLNHDVFRGIGELLLSLHHYRADARWARHSGPLGHSLFILMLPYYYSASVSRIFASDMKMDRDTLVDEADTMGMASVMAHWYLHRWEDGDPRSHELDIAWRHLDVYYPFFLLFASSRRLLSEIRVLVMVVNTTFTSIPWESRSFMNVWTMKFMVMHSNMIQDVETLSAYIWLRLETENKVFCLGGVPDTVARGLFHVEDPISADLRKFFRVVDSLSAIFQQSQKTESAMSVFKELNEPTASDALMILDTLSSPTVWKSDFRPSPPLPSKHRRSTTTESTTSNRGGNSQLRETKRPLLKARISVQSKKSTTKGMDSQGTTKSAYLARPHARPYRNASLERKVKYKATNPPGRGYCTDARVVWDSKARQCGVHETGMAPISKDNRVDETQPLPVPSRDTESYGSVTLGAGHSNTMSCDVSIDNTEKTSDLASTSDKKPPEYWSHNQHKAPDGGRIPVYYCKTLEQAERAAALFSSSAVLGFDIEWKAQAQITSGIKSNVSLIQIANDERIALFHIALFKGNEIHDLVPPSLRQLLESPETLKVGVSIKADCSRIRRHLAIDVRGQFELSHLYKLVKYGSTQPKLVDRRAVNLTQQVEEMLGLPLRKDVNVRTSDWTKPLDYDQVQYAASDAYACICLHRVLEAKRKSLTPVPPLPALAELNLPILLVEKVENKETRAEAEVEEDIVELSIHTKKSLEIV